VTTHAKQKDANIHMDPKKFLMYLIAKKRFTSIMIIVMEGKQNVPILTTVKIATIGLMLV